jgi:hypothetical protein
MILNDLSIVILTNRNDDRFINSLKSAQIAKNVIVIDNKSNNNWSDLNNYYQFKIIDYPVAVTSFSRTKNLGLEKVTTKWVLFLDSDEVLSQNAGIEIGSIIKSDLYDAISINRVDYFLNKPLKYGETGNIQLVRLFKTKNGKFVRKVHEIVEHSGNVGEANFFILHYSHNSIKDFINKISMYAHMESKTRNHSLIENTLQLCIFPISKFIYNYIFKLGFLDGFRGLIYAVIMSFHSFFVRVFYYENI